MPKTIFSKYQNVRIENLVWRVEQDENAHGMRVGHITVSPLFIYEDGETFGFFGDSVYDGEVMLNLFRIRCQYNMDASESEYGADAREPYAYNAGYTDLSLDVRHIEKAEAKLKFLRWLGRRLDKVHTDIGLYCDEGDMSFGQYVKIVLTIISGGEPTLVKLHRTSRGFEKIYKDVERLVDDAIANGSISY